MMTIEKPVFCYEPTAVLAKDENGSPIVSIQCYFDDPDAPNGTGVIRIYLEPVEAKRFGLAALRAGQNGIDREIELERMGWREKP